jgi:hypothetical protein
VYNYGTFDFRTKGFYIKFLRGLLPYRLAVEDISTFLNEYHYTHRGVREQILEIRSEEKQKIWLYLQENMKPENIEYPYDFFFDNCSTRVRDLIINQLNPDQRRNEILDQEGDLTFRQMLHKYLKASPWVRLGIDLIIGKRADRLATIGEQMFLPDYLHDNLTTLKNSTNSSLTSESYQVLDFSEMRQKVMTTSTNWPLLIFATLSIIFLFLRYKYSYFITALMIMMGLCGCIILFMTVGTVHYATKLNFNLMFLHPGFLIIPLLRGKSRTTFVMICMTMVLLFILMALVGLTNSIVSTWPVIMFVLCTLLLAMPLKSDKLKTPSYT